MNKWHGIRFVDGNPDYSGCSFCGSQGERFALEHYGPGFNCLIWVCLACLETARRQVEPDQSAPADPDWEMTCTCT